MTKPALLSSIRRHFRAADHDRRQTEHVVTMGPEEVFVTLNETEAAFFQARLKAAVHLMEDKTP